MDEIDKLINETLKQEITNEIMIKLYYNIGKIINKNNINTKDLELFLKQKYGIVIAFTNRNLINMKNFSLLDNSLLSKLERITWKNILVILKNDISLIDICFKYKPTKQELLDYIKINKQLKKNVNLELDDTLEEIKRLKNVIMK